VNPGPRAAARRAALVLSAAAGLASAAPPAFASFHQVGRPEVDRQALVFLVDAVSFEELLAVPEIRALARAGGAGLMSPRTVPGDAGPGAYLTLGAGARSAAPSPRVVAYDRGEPLDGRTADDLWAERYPDRDFPVGPFLLEVGPYVRANEGRSVPGLLAGVLRGARRTVAVFGNSDTEAGRDRPGILVGMDPRGDGVGGRIGVVFAPRPGGRGGPLAVPIARPDPDALGGFRTDFDALAFAALGGRIPNPSPWLPAHLTVFDMGDTRRIDVAADGAPLGRVLGERRAALARIGERIASLVGRAAAREVLVIVVAPSTSRDMDARKDELTPIVLARGDPAELFPEEGPLHALTSDTTRRVGVVSNEDVAPTILRFFGLFLRPEMRGAPIRVVEDAPAPFALHARHLANRRMTVPVQAGAGVAVALAGLVCAWLVVRGARAPLRLRRAAAWAGLAVPPAAVALLLAGHLPTLSYATVIPTVLAITACGTLPFLPLRRVSAFAPPAAVALATILALAAEAGHGWTAALTPFLGGSELDGARFYGMPNVYIGLLLGCGLWAASRLRPWSGAALLGGLALFAGLPGAGANLGGAITLWFGAGLWVGVRTGGRLGIRELAMGAATAALGTGVVLLAHAVLPGPPTHVARFAARAAGGLGGVLEVLRGRLSVSVGLVLRNPLALVPLVGSAVVAAGLVHPPSLLRPALERDRAWWDALLVTAVGGVVAYLANDTGPSAAGLAFGAALAGAAWAALSVDEAPVEAAACRSGAPGAWRSGPEPG
jgi:hypothetical protein